MQGLGTKSTFSAGKTIATSNNNNNHNVYRSASVDSDQMTQLSGDTDLTTASQTVSEDGIDNAVRIRKNYDRAMVESTKGLNTNNSANRNRGSAAASHIGGTGQVPVCTLCDSASSDFSCRACGGLTFCEKCALSLHTNKFLGSHELQNILDDKDTVLGSDLAIRRATMESERAAKEIYSDDARAARRAIEEETLKQTLRLSEDAGRERAREDAEMRREKELKEARDGPKLDMKSITADRSVLTARGKELRSCIEILRRLGMRLAEEQASCIDATRTAGDAIRKKFDLLRNLINQKEAQFLGVVQDAGKSRHEAAANQRTAVAAAVAETTAFVDNLELQLQRLDGNHVMFDESRAGLLEDSRTKISSVDNLIHKFEGVVQEVREIPLGVVVPVDGIVTALQMLQPPERTVGSSEVAMLNAAEALLPVPADSFEKSLGVKHFRSNVGEGNGNNGESNNNLNSSTMSVASRSGTMMKRSDSPASSGRIGNTNNSRPFEIREVSSQQPNRVSISQQQQGGATRTSSPYSQRHGGAGMPSEVRELRRHLMAAQQQNSTPNNTNSRPQSPMTMNRSSPSRRPASPTSMSSSSQQVYPRSNSPMSRSLLQSAQNRTQQQQQQLKGNPGPGSYYQAYPLNSRQGPLSTPPRKFRN